MAFPSFQLFLMAAGRPRIFRTLFPKIVRCDHDTPCGRLLVCPSRRPTVCVGSQFRVCPPPSPFSSWDLFARALPGGFRGSRVCVLISRCIYLCLSLPLPKQALQNGRLKHTRFACSFVSSVCLSLPTTQRRGTRKECKCRFLNQPFPLGFP